MPGKNDILVQKREILRGGKRRASGDEELICSPGRTFNRAWMGVLDRVKKVSGREMSDSGRECFFRQSFKKIVSPDGISYKVS